MAGRCGHLSGLKQQHTRRKAFVVHQTLQLAGVVRWNSQCEHSTSDSLPTTPKGVQVLCQWVFIAESTRGQHSEMGIGPGYAYGA